MKQRTRITASALVLMLILGAVACSDWERSTFQSLSASKAVIDQAQVDYEAGTVIPHNQIAYDAITKAKASQTLAVQAMATYEGIKANKGTQSALQAQQAIVAGILAQIPALIYEVKALYAKGGTK